MGRGTRPDIRAVAEAAGVSPTTVSHALSGKGRLPATTRERVRRVAEQLGYRPSPSARNLAGGRSGVLGFTFSSPPGQSFVFSDFAYFVQLMAAATTAAMDLGYALVLSPAERGFSSTVELPIDGAIVIDPVAGDAVIKEVTANGLPLVTTGRIPGADASASWVDNDHAAGAQSVLEHLSSRGAQRIALMTSPARISYTEDVETAYQLWSAERGLPSRIVEAGSDLSERAGFDAAIEMFDAGDSPDAIYALFDRPGYGVLLAAEARGLAVPDDLLLVVTATESAGHRHSPNLTALDLFPEQIGAQAAQLLVALVNGQETDPHVIVPTRIRQRTSTRRPLMAR